MALVCESELYQLYDREVFSYDEGHISIAKCGRRKNRLGIWSVGSVEA